MDPGYLTTRPGTRESSFYYAPNTDPAVVATDESLKETATAPEALGVFAQELPGALRPLTAPLCELTPQSCDGIASSSVYGITRQINVPVLEVVGQSWTSFTLEHDTGGDGACWSSTSAGMIQP